MESNKLLHAPQPTEYASHCIYLSPVIMQRIAAYCTTTMAKRWRRAEARTKYH